MTAYGFISDVGPCDVYDVCLVSPSRNPPRVEEEDSSGVNTDPEAKVSSPLALN